MLTSSTKITSKEIGSVYIKPYKISKNGNVLYDTLTVAFSDLSSMPGIHTATANEINVCLVDDGVTEYSFADSTSYDNLGVAFGEYTHTFVGEDGIRYYTTSDVTLAANVTIEYLDLGTIDGEHMAVVKSMQTV